MTLTVHGSQLVYHDTKINLEALSGLPADTKGFATDDKDSGWYDGSAWHWVSESGGGGGNVSDTGATTANHLAVWNGASDHIIKDGGAVPTGGGDVLGPAASTNNNLAVWNGTDNKTLKDGGAVPTGGGDVLGPATSTNNNLAVWNGTDNKTLKDGGAVPAGSSPDGWVAISGTFTYASATTINVSSGAAAIYSVGDKIRFQNNHSGTYLYAYIITIADILLTVVGTAVPSATLTDAYYSKAETPLGFPSQFAWTPTPTNLTFGSGALTAVFSMHGRTIFFIFKWLFGANSAVSGDVSFTLPTSVAIDATEIARFLDSGNTTYFGSAYIDSATGKCIVRVMNVGATYPTPTNLSSTVPMTWTTNDGIYVSGTYLI